MTNIEQYETDRCGRKILVAHTTRAQAELTAEIWNRTSALWALGPATVRARPEYGWHTTVTVWA